MGKSVKRLFADFKPKHYILELSPNREKKTFNGMVIISGHKTGRPSKRLTFHQNGLKIKKAHITFHDKKGDQIIEVERINHHGSFDEVRLHAKHLIYPGNYTVRLEFSGKITQNMNGIYPCSFEQNGKKKQLIATQFESHHAREVFPSIDEPEAKATFDLTLTTPAGEAVLANTPVKRQKTNGKFVTTTFETTPHMSTYLLAFIYGELDYKESRTKDGVIVRTYATKANVKHLDFALKTAVKSLEFFNEYFAIPYPLSKCDMVALPDFASGAMENWGLITYREQALLVDPKNTSLGMKQYVAMVIAHELTHQWFGNLVTMKWWTDLWLNEGFASWMSYLATDALFPDWQMWTQFAVDEQQRALKLDALEHTHPIEVPVSHPDEIRTIFDAISYEKGASAIHMLKQYLGQEAFRDGLRLYLKRHAYANTDTTDLWAALEEISGKPVREFMRDWTAQPGFPIVEAEVENHTLNLKQSRFYINPKVKHRSDDKWPIALQAHDDSVPETLTTARLTAKHITSEELKLNQEQSGFYRVAYNSTHLQRLGQLIKRGHLKPLDRLGILSDLFESAKAGYADTIDALNFLSVFENEDNNAVWDVIASDIVSVRGVMNDEELRELMKPFIRKLVAKQASRLGWKPKKSESHFDSLLRPTILGLAAGADDPDVLKECLRQFKDMEKPEDIQPDLRGVIYNTAARHGDEKTFDKLFAIHEATASSEERVTIAAALTSFKQPELVKRALSLIKSDSVRLQDVAYWIAYSYANRFGRDATWKWMTNPTNWKWLSDNLGTDLSFYRFPIYAASAFSDPEFLNKFEKFFLPRKEPAFERSINQGIEFITWQSAWKKRDFKEVFNFFKTKSNQ